MFKVGDRVLVVDFSETHHGDRRTVFAAQGNGIILVLRDQDLRLLFSDQR